jgi:hypothetical protein
MTVPHDEGASAVLKLLTPAGIEAVLRSCPTATYSPRLELLTPCRTAAS